MIGNVTETKVAEERTSLKEWDIQVMWGPRDCVLTYYAQQVSGNIKRFRQSGGIKDKFRLSLDGRRQFSEIWIARIKREEAYMDIIVLSPPGQLPSRSGSQVDTYGVVKRSRWI